MRELNQDEQRQVSGGGGGNTGANGGVVGIAE
jgi:hypothetical protein